MTFTDYSETREVASMLVRLTPPNPMAIVPVSAVGIGRVEDVDMLVASVVFANRKALVEFYTRFYARIGMDPTEAIDAWFDGSNPDADLETSFAGDNAERAADVANECVGVTCALSEDYDPFCRANNDPSLKMQGQG